MTNILATIQSKNCRNFAEYYDMCDANEFQELVISSKDYDELIKSCLLISNKYRLDAQRSDLYKYALNLAEEHQTPDVAQFSVFKNIFDFNRIDIRDFSSNLFKLLTKSVNKKNAIRLWGIPDSGKSLIGNCIVAPFICCYLNNHGSENEFYLSNMLNKSIILCEELYVTQATCEDFKSILGGQNIDVAKKFNEKQVLHRVPIVVTSNYERFGRGHLSSTDEYALKIRCFNYEFVNNIKPSIMLEWQQFYLFMSAYL